MQELSEKSKKEVQNEQIWSLFEEIYLKTKEPLEYINYVSKKDDQPSSDIEMTLEINKHSKPKQLKGTGNGPIDAAKHALETLIGPFKIEDFVTHSRKQGSNSEAVAYMKLSYNQKTHFGVGIDTNTNSAAIKALISALNHLLKT